MCNWKRWAAPVIAAMLFLSGCGLKDKVLDLTGLGESAQEARQDLEEEEEKDDEDDREETQEEAEEETEEAEEEILPEEDPVENNGGTVVGYHGNRYYWRYSPESKNSSGLFGYFPYDPNVENELVCRYADGTEEVIFTGAGNGDIYMAGDRIYLQNGSSDFYSVDLSGGDRVDYTGMDIWAADDEAGTVVAQRLSPTQGISVVDVRSGGVYPVYEGFATYAGTIDGCVYFSAADSATGELVLYQLRTDGTDLPKEIDRCSIDEEYGAGSYVTEITQIGDTLYYSYGCYAGTGGFFQTGGINSVKTDGSGHMECVEPGIIQAEEFLAAPDEDDVLIYYIGPDNEMVGSYIGYWDDSAYGRCTMKSMATGETLQIDFPLSRQGSFVYLDGTVSRIMENEADYEILIPEETAAAVGLTEEEDTSQLVLIKDAEILGRELFFTVETSVRDAGADIGWREGYSRTRSDFYTMEIGGNQPELIYSY